MTLHENIYHQWRSGLIDQESFASRSRDLEWLVRQQHLRDRWPVLDSYYEASFARHVTALIAHMAQETV